MTRLIVPLYFFLLCSVLYYGFAAEALADNELIVLGVYAVFIGFPCGLLIDGYRKAPVVSEQPDE
jgi:hypothetical protein